MRDDQMTPEIERDLDAIEAALRGETAPPELTELGALALALREDRPTADPFFTRELDSRAAAGFPKPSRGSRVAKWLSVRPLAIPGVAASALIALVMAVAVLGGPSGGDDAGESGAGGGYVADSEVAGGGSVEEGYSSAPGAGGADDAGVGEGAMGTVEDDAEEPVARQKKRAAKTQTATSGSSAAGSDDSIAPPATPPSTGTASPKADGRSARKVEHSASLVLASPSDEVARTADGIIRVTDGLGGFVVSSSVSSTQGGGSGTFELRIPSAKLQQGLAQLSRLANVRERQEARQDITASFVSARERLADARAERAGLLRALAKADTLDESRALRARLRTVSSRIAAAKSDLARVNNRADYSTVMVTLVGDDSATDPGAGGDGTWTPGDAARDALRVLEVAAGVALIALAVALPLGLIAGLAVLTGRAVTRRRRERVLDAI